MKIYTDLEQSKKLVETLPIESADMYYSDNEYPKQITKYHITYANVLYGSYDIQFFDIYGYIPCWSLAALLEEIPDTIINNVGEDLKLHIDKDGFQYSLFYENEYTGNMFEIETELYDDMIDACYEMIIKLHELKIL